MTGYKKKTMGFDVDKLIKRGIIQNELELERALIAERKLRVLSRENPALNNMRKKLRDFIEAYETQNWSEDSEISNERLKESDSAEILAERERVFLSRRKGLIRSKLKKMDLTQQEFGLILGHKSKSYMSELMNGISPFSLKDLIVINKILKIDFTDLIPAFLSPIERDKIKSSIKQLNNKRVKFS